MFFSSGAGNTADLWRRRADLSSPSELVLELEGLQLPLSVSADGSLLLFASGAATGGADLLLLNLEGDPDPRPVVATAADEDRGSLSPDGRFLAFESDESGEFRIYVREIATNRQWPISTALGLFPTWSPRGDEIFFRTLVDFMVAAVTTDPEFSAAAPELFTSSTGTPRGNFTVSHDGERLLYYALPGTGQSPGEAGPAPRLRVVLNWFDELEQRVPLDR